MLGDFITRILVYVWPIHLVVALSLNYPVYISSGHHGIMKDTPILLIFAWMSMIIRLLLGYAYPAFECFKSVEKNRIDIDEIRFWCQYWIIIAVLTVCERIGDIFVSWLPMYGETKLAFIIYLWYPKTKGTNYIYQTLLRPYVASHETHIDRKLQELKARAWDFAIYYWQNCTKLGQTTFLQGLQYLASQSGKFTNSSMEKRDPFEPSTPPVPTPNTPPSATKQGSKNIRWPAKPPPPPRDTSTKINTAVSDSPKSNRVQANLYSQTEAVQTLETDSSTEIEVNDKLQQARMKLRRAKPIQTDN